MRFLILILLLFLGCEDDPVSPDDCDGYALGGTSCQFTANILLTNNSTPFSNADVFIKYDCPESAQEGGEVCNGVSPRATQQIFYDIPSSGQAKIDIYNLDGILISNLVDEYHEAGAYNFSYNPSDVPIHFGLSVVKIVLEHNQQIIEKYSINTLLPDAIMTNLGSTNNSGEFTLDSNFLTIYNIPTFYNIPDIEEMDAFGNSTGYHSINNEYDNLFIYFSYDGVYKRFDIDLRNGNYNYSFDWINGEVFNPSFTNINNDTFSRITEDDTPTSALSLIIFPNPF